MTTAPFIEEFLIRGQPDGLIAWHVVLGADMPDGFGSSQRVLRGPLTPTGAAEMGVTLDTILGDVLAGALLRTEVAETAQRVATDRADAADLALTGALDREAILKAQVEEGNENSGVLAEQLVNQTQRAVSAEQQVVALLAQLADLWPPE
jgi:hypothetical protein